MAVPYTFGSATSSIPLSELDSNFSTPITLGNTSIQLGNTVTTLNNMTLTNVTISSVASTFPNNYLANSTATLGNSTITLGGTTSSVGNLTLVNATISSGSVSITDITASGNVTLSGGTANAVAYLNGSKVLTTGSALTFDGSFLTAKGAATSGTAVNTALFAGGTAGTTGSGAIVYLSDGGTARAAYISGFNLNGTTNAHALSFGVSSDYAAPTEQMRLTSTGLGIGTSSPQNLLNVMKASNYASPASTAGIAIQSDSGTTYSVGLHFGTDKANSVAYIQSDSSASYTAVPLVLQPQGGNLGLGVTPSAWSGITGLQVSTKSSIGGDSSGAYFSSNWYYNTGNKYIGNGYATSYQQYSGQHVWFTAGNNVSGAGAAITFTQAMTLDASGNLGIGTSSPGYKLHIQSATPIVTIQDTTSAAGGVGGTINFIGNTSGAGSPNVEAQIKGVKSSANAAGELQFFTSDSVGNSTQRAIIDSSGNLLVNATSSFSAGKLQVQTDDWASQFYTTANSGAGLCLSTRRNNDGVAVAFLYNGSAYSSAVGNISVTSTSTAYNTSSDYRLKENIQPMTGALARVAALKPCTYKWKADGSDGEGFIAHELAEVVPQCVTGEKDAVDAEGKPLYQGIDTSFLVATLTAAIQEQQAIINQLKSRLDAANL